MSGLISQGRSGSFFYYSHDNWYVHTAPAPRPNGAVPTPCSARSYMVKTVSSGEYATFVRIFADYYQYMFVCAVP
jgi:hypothetical protein